MLPNNRLSYIPVAGVMHAPDANKVGPLVDFERGGVMISDPSQGLMVQDWTFAYTPEGRITVTSEDGYTEVLIAHAGVTELSGTFDQNMSPVVAYVIDGEVFLNWYDTQAGVRRTDSFGQAYTPRLTLDDKRSTQVGTSDVILAYVRNQTLYCRQQRDRFAVETTLKTGLSPITRLKNIGMTTQLRLLFELA